MTEYRVTYTVSIRGTMTVEAESAEAARRKVIDDAEFPDVTYPATCELFDWDAERATEEK